MGTTLRIAWDTWWAGRAGREGLRARQQRRLAALVDFARTHSRCYAELYRHLPAPVEDVRQLPPVTKRAMMAHFEDWVTDPAITRSGVEAFLADESTVGQDFLDRYLVWTTSGSTGEPAILVQDRNWLASQVAMSLVRMAPAWFRGRAVRQFLGRKARTSVIFATGGHYVGVTLAKRRGRVRPDRAGRIQILSVLSPLPELVQKLNDYRPALLIGYATVLVLLAQEQEAGRLRIAPALVISSGESLPVAEQAHLETVWGAPVRDAYASSETGIMAYDCGHGWLHLHADWTILEPVDGEHRPVPPGEPSHTVLVTNLANRVQPIIRYELGDSVTVKPEPCPCGSPLPAIRVEGRTDEILTFPAEEGARVRLSPAVLATVVEETPGVYLFQIIQTQPTRLRVRLEARPGADPETVWSAVQERLRAHLSVYGLPHVDVERASEPPARNPRGGKFRQVWSEMERG